MVAGRGGWEGVLGGVDRWMMVGGGVDRLLFIKCKLQRWGPSVRAIVHRQ